MTCLAFVSRLTGRLPFSGRRLGAWRVAMLCWLLFTVPVYGTSGVLLQLLGPAHQHQAVEAAASPDDEEVMASVDWLQRGVQHLIGHRAAALLDSMRVQARLHEERQPHHHGLFEHHHHAADDRSVVVLGASAAQVQALGDGAAVGGAMLPFGLASWPALPAPLPEARHWPPVKAAAWASAELAQHERPPRA